MVGNAERLESRIVAIAVVASLLAAAATVGALAITGTTGDLGRLAATNQPSAGGDPAARLASVRVATDPTEDDPVAGFRVRNGLDATRPVTFDLVGTRVAGGLDVPSGTDRFSQVPRQPGPTIVRLFVDGERVGGRVNDAVPCTPARAASVGRGVE